MNGREWVFVPEPGLAAPPAAELGGKGHHLVRLLAMGDAMGFRVPSFIVVRTGAFDRWGAAGAGWPASAEEADRERARMEALEIPQVLRAEILDALATQHLLGAQVAVRSSAAAEDGSNASYAGQFETVLGVLAADGAELWSAFRSVWASAFLARAAAYRAERGAPAAAVRMGVVFQEMVDPEASGVAFSMDPVSRDPDTAVVSAVFGLGEGLVSGELDADTYRVRAGGAVSATRVHKDRALRAGPGGRPRAEAVPEPLRDAPVLSDDDARRVAACARALADALGAPQDVEWALLPSAAGPRELVVLQTRPITTLGTGASRSSDRRVWDNSNIIESYHGVTTPLTFTFARRVYEDVYEQFCRVMGVSETLIQANRPVFANMLGLVRGRVYYNLLHWYRTLGLLPGFEFNRGFMERMMGVRESLEDPPPPPGAGGRLRDLARLVRMVLRMMRESGRLATEVPSFQARVDATLAPLSRLELATLSEAELIGIYHGLERDLLRHWRAPLVNDFFAMIHFGVLCRLIETWLPAAPPTLANDLLCGEGGIISTEPARRVMALAGRVAADPALARRFAEQPDDAVLLRTLRDDPECAEFHLALRDYVERFGDRCLEELKLETVTLRENPGFLIQMIRSYAVSGTVDPDAQRARESRIRSDAEALVSSRLGGIRRGAFRWVLRRARRRVRDRENLRFERTRVFGMVRRLFVALGERLARSGRLGSPRDVFHLTIDEVLSIADGGSGATDLASRAAERRAEFARFEQGPVPPDRFVTEGTPVMVFGAEAPADDAIPSRAGAYADTHGTLQGTGCCPGVVRARVRVVRDPREVGDIAGRILVAERTDPGWTLLFPAARGLLVQRGSLLSHSAIVAREMGLPCVVGIAGLLDTLEDGELVEMDGGSGRVTRLDAEAGT